RLGRRDARRQGRRRGRAGAAAQRDERGDARRLYPRLRDRREALEPPHPEGRLRPRAAPALAALPPLDRPLGGPVRRPPRPPRPPSWIPSGSDRAFGRSLMHGGTEPGRMAGWIAPPDRGINNLPVAYEYVRLQ